MESASRPTRQSRHKKKKEVWSTGRGGGVHMEIPQRQNKFSRICFGQSTPLSLTFTLLKKNTKKTKIKITLGWATRQCAWAVQTSNVCEFSHINLSTYEDAFLSSPPGLHTSGEHFTPDPPLFPLLHAVGS